MKRLASFRWGAGFSLRTDFNRSSVGACSESRAEARLQAEACPPMGTHHAVKALVRRQQSSIGREDSRQHLRNLKYGPILDSRHRRSILLKIAHRLRHGLPHM